MFLFFSYLFQDLEPDVTPEQPGSSCCQPALGGGLPLVQSKIWMDRQVLRELAKDCKKSCMELDFVALHNII